MDDQPAATWADYRAAVTRFVTAIDSVLEEGRATEMRYQNFCRQHGITPGSGADILTSEALSPRQRYIHGRMLALTENLYRTLLSRTPERPRTLPSTASRALGSRSRI